LHNEKHKKGGGINLDSYKEALWNAFESKIEDTIKTGKTEFNNELLIFWFGMSDKNKEDFKKYFYKGINAKSLKQVDIKNCIAPYIVQNEEQLPLSREVAKKNKPYPYSFHKSPLKRVLNGAKSDSLERNKNDEHESCYGPAQFCLTAFSPIAYVGHKAFVNPVINAVQGLQGIKTANMTSAKNRAADIFLPGFLRPLTDIPNPTFKKMAFESFNSFMDSEDVKMALKATYDKTKTELQNKNQITTQSL
jgi:hypothetical protein